MPCSPIDETGSSISFPLMDLTTATGVHAYLTRSLSLDVDPGGVSRLDGGYVNFTWRVKLNTTHRGHGSLIVKHATAQLSSDQSVEVELERQTYEYQALKIVHESSLVSDSVSVPEALYFDPDQHVLVMQDAGSLPTLLDFMSTQPYPSTDMAALIGSQIGAFIAGLHNRGGDDNLRHFSGNSAGRNGFITCFQTIISNAAKYGIHDPLLETVAAELEGECLDSEENLIMGDFWFGNLLLQFDDAPTQGPGSAVTASTKKLQKIWIIDWEMCRYGSPAVDIVPIVGESLLISRFRDKLAGEALRNSYLETYASLSNIPLDYGRVIKGIGAHLIMWTAILGWGSEEETKDCIEKGVQYVRQGHDRSYSDGHLLSALNPL